MCVKKNIFHGTSLQLFIVLLLLSGIVQANVDQNNSTVPSLPDLNDCSRIEIEFKPSVFSFFYTTDGMMIWNEADLSYFESLEVFVSEDAVLIRSLNDLMDYAIYASEENPIESPFGATYHITCFKDNEAIASLAMRRDRVNYGSSVFFINGYTWANLLRDFTPQLYPYEVRLYCAKNIQVLYSHFEWRYFYKFPYPDPNHWCDDVFEGYKYKYLYERSPFRCPSVNESQYAMNPLCEPNSPDDTVLLFETTTGWNQHGGPELFTFDNHDPKGGCVVLNDGSVKFIRTEEELNCLRWDPNKPSDPNSIEQ